MELLPQLVTLYQAKPGVTDLAVCLDMRTRISQQYFLPMLEAIEHSVSRFDVLFLEAQKEVLLHRFSETRRRHPDTRIVLGLREVLDAPKVAAREWAELGEEDFLAGLVDEVWVYGDRSVHNTATTGELPAALAERARFTGYLSHGRDLNLAPARWDAEVPFVLTTVGGGSDGAELARVAAAAPVPAGHSHLVVTGPQMPAADQQVVRDAAGPATRVVTSVNGLSPHLAKASAVVTMGGYNSVCEILATDTPALVVPRESPRTEQLIRARSLRRVGALDLLRERDLTPDAVGEWLARAVTRRCDRSTLLRDGLARVPHLVASLLDPTQETVA